MVILQATPPHGGRKMPGVARLRSPYTNLLAFGLTVTPLRHKIEEMEGGHIL